jgi:exodeoxyribonuclease V beta subunit
MHGDEVSNTFYEILTTRIRFLLIDEFQDTSILQFKLFLPIIKEITSGEGVKPYGGIIVVGDEKQSIYSWRGGERDFILRMPQLIPDLQQLP